MPPTAFDPSQIRKLSPGTWVDAVALLFSFALHFLLVVPYVVYQVAFFELDTPGEDTLHDGPVGNDGGQLLSPAAPVRISVYQEKKKAPPPTKSAPAAPAPSPEPQPEGGVEGQDQGAVDGQGDASADGSSGTAKRSGVKGRPPRGNKKPCEPIEEVVQVNESTWRVERDLLDWYAGHLGELEKQAGVATNRGPDGKKNGARLYLPRCSVLRQGGFKNGDVVHSVNGHKVNTIPQGVATYLKVRNDRVLKVELTRKNGETLTHSYRLK